MLFTETRLKGAWIIGTEPKHDDRGFFSRMYCAREFAEHGLKTDIAQSSIGFNLKAGTLRGMHFQVSPATEVKLVRCTRGAIYDVIIDLRPDSPTYLQHFTTELTQDNRNAVYIPEMFAHGYQTLTDSAEVIYQMNEFFAPGYASGVRYNDPAFGISWPLPVTIISERDAAWPLLKD
jgi:dTDP-4-dehydrorhamnose 3,5-epimerase